MTLKTINLLLNQINKAHLLNLMGFPFKLNILETIIYFVLQQLFSPSTVHSFLSVAQHLCLHSL